MSSTVDRAVCDACNGVWFAETAHDGKCPSCKGRTRVRKCEVNDAGVVTPIAEKK